MLRADGEWKPADWVDVTSLSTLMAEESHLPKVICWSNKTRQRINEECSKLWPTIYSTKPLPFYTKGDEGTKFHQDYQLYVNMPVLCKKTAENHCNNDWGEIAKYEEEKVTVLMARKFLLEFTLAEFCEAWIPAFAITMHSAQGTTSDWQYAVAEFGAWIAGFGTRPSVGPGGWIRF